MKVSMLRKILRILIKIILIMAIPVAIVGCQLLQTIGANADQERVTRYEKLPYYRDGRFQGAKELPFYPDRVTGGRSGWGRFLFTSPNAPKAPLPQVALNAASFPAQPEELAAYWLGHATVIIELEGKRFMVDPIFGNAAPLPGIVRRYTDAPIPRKDLPPIDYILITHDHYDHLEYATVRAFREKPTRFIVPYGVGAHLKKWGIPDERIHEIGWGERFEADGIDVISEQTLHYSGRTFERRNTTLWSAYVLKGKKYRLFICGDTGYGEHFKAIGERHAPFDLAFIEIDGWNPGWPNTHMFPEEVIRAYHEIGARALLPVHWGVFDLALHNWRESIRKIRVLADQDGKVRLLTPRMGEKLIPGQTRTEDWWEEVKE